MTVKNLSNISTDELIDCFLLAFENYFVEMPTNRDYYKNYWKASKVDFNLSYGMFDNGKLVAFIIHAIDRRNGVLTAYNAGTGVIKEYRGQRIVKSIYDFALKDLVQNGILNVSLEVITKNEVAIRSYQSIGFEIDCTLKCFSGTIKLEKESSFEIEKIDWDKINWNNLPNQEFYSWDNQRTSIPKTKCQYFEVLNNGVAESYLIINPDNGYLSQFDLFHSEPKAWNRLFSAIQQISNSVKINNVDSRLKDKIAFLNSIRLKNTVDQYEMRMVLERL